MRLPIRLGLTLLLSPTTFAQTHPDVAEILQKVSETYKGASQYELAADFKGRDERTGKQVAGHMDVAVRASDRYRIEGLPGMLGRGTIVYDGSAVWFYLPESNQYGSFPASALTPDAPGDLGDLRPEAVDSFLMQRYWGATDFAADTRFLREQPIEYGGAKVNCYVLSISEKETKLAYTWWVDTKRHLILREDHGDSSTVFATIKLGGPIPDDRFKFTPPPGAQKVEMQR